ncbi:DUF5134 domain-containing protein [Streptomyces silvisoli]|uniref:DUF5134 domain-containing protein n=1 Tax=Streptomyces silvisoli TaxID=3034235 RepID=A0ABT5ZQ56_9ACTN|nr:DUF5134 domain-containing protein [Streptomyces silvisoli]MDF3291922.1 DUF5134 domain-containing protein [Streptomyces silvisoli]
MAHPSWLADTFAAIMLAIAVSCAARLLTSWRTRREVELDADITHLAMGISMAGMLTPRLNSLPNSIWDGTFALASAWFAARTIRNWRGDAAHGWRCPHPLPHMVESGAMLYMLLAMRNPAPGDTDRGMATGMPRMAGASGMTRFPTLALILALFMIGYVVWLGDRLTPAPLTTNTHTRDTANNPADSRTQLTWCAPTGVPILTPRLAACHKIAMGITMGYTLITMV